MFYSKNEFITKIHLLISACIVIPVSLIYGFIPQSQFNIQLQTIDEHNFFKAIMGIYLGFSILWLLGIFKNNFLKTALISNMIFMLGLSFGRLLSFYFDGSPTFGFTIGTFFELFLGIYGAWILSNKNSIFAKNKPFW